MSFYRSHTASLHLSSSPRRSRHFRKALSAEEAKRRAENGYRALSHAHRLRRLLLHSSKALESEIGKELRPSLRACGLSTSPAHLASLLATRVHPERARLSSEQPHLLYHGP